jgi:SSS family solute:Na+ symporter
MTQRVEDLRRAAERPIQVARVVAIVKDILIYATVIAAFIVIPARLDGFASIFSAAQHALAQAPKPASIQLASTGYSAYATLAFGSALALFMYPHAITGVLSAKSTDVIRRNMAVLPAYSLLLGLIALFGYMVLAAGLHPAAPNDAVPALFKQMFPSWFVGIAFGAIGIGALVPAAVMSIAAANLYTRNIHIGMLTKAPTPQEETAIAKLASLLVKTGALLAVLLLPAQFSIYYQLFAGALILQTLPTILIGLYTRWFHRRALLAGWVVGMATAIWMIVANHFASTYPLHVFGQTIIGYIGLYAVAANLAASTVLTILFDALKLTRGNDRTAPSDYLDEDDVPLAAAGTRIG